jgi:hypothetical protein
MCQALNVRPFSGQYRFLLAMMYKPDLAACPFFEVPVHRIVFTIRTEFTLQDLRSFCLECFDEPDELKQVSDTKQRPIATYGYEGIGRSQVCKADGNRRFRPRIVVVVYPLISPVVAKVPDLELTTEQRVKGMDHPKVSGSGRPVGRS